MRYLAMLLIALSIVTTHAYAKPYQFSLNSTNMTYNQFKNNYDYHLHYGPKTVRMNVLGVTMMNGNPIIFGRDLMDGNKEYEYYLPMSYAQNGLVINNIVNSPGQGTVLLDIDCNPDGCSQVIQGRSATIIYLKSK